MRTRIWLLGIIALAICILLVLFRPSEGEKQSNLQEAQTSDSNRPVQATRSESPTVQRHHKADANSTPVPSAATPPPATPYNPTVIGPNLLTNWQAPIEFYGKVVDEHSNAIAGAKVSFQWMETPDETGSRSTNAETDTRGLFSLQGARGPSLSVSVSKEGHYPRDGGAQYGPLAAASFSPDPQNPVIFQLRKKGTPEPLVMVNRSYRIARDGTPVSIDLVTGANTPGGNGNLVVRCWTNDRGKRSAKEYDWRCVVTIPGGGVVTTDEEFPFLAPENDYKPTLEINMPADRTNWNSQVDLKLYYRLANGQYGRMMFSMIAGGQHFCMIDSVLNPTGSRNLEPAN